MDSEKISYSQIEGLCNELHASANIMKDTLDKIIKANAQINANDTWIGPAASNYINEFNKLNTVFEKAYTELENSILYMAKVSDGYQAIDKNVMGEICQNLGITQPGLQTSDMFKE